MYALSCNHLIPRENEHACTRHFGKVVACVPTTKTKGCDFAAVEIKECYSNSCNVAFVKDNKKKINATYIPTAYKMVTLYIKEKQQRK